MSETRADQYEIDVQDVEYLRHGERGYLARIFRPRGEGSFPAIVDVHGGAWSMGDRLFHTVIAEPLARSGIVVASLDYRTPLRYAYPGDPHDSVELMKFYLRGVVAAQGEPVIPGTGYPAQIADVNFGVRWLKARAAEFGVDPARVGIMGGSSGGHVAALAALRPHDPRYSAISLPAGAPAVDAEVRFGVLLWPVIEPLNRFQMAKRLKASDNPPRWADALMKISLNFWPDEEAMAEGSPRLIVERGEAVAKPPLLYIQSTGDPAHPREDVDRFVDAYRRLGGSVDLQIYDSEHEAFTHSEPGSPEAERAIANIIAFVHDQN